ncbi:MAG: hypothetical protein ACI4D2_07065 [Lachnospiraceae bacterium]
MTEGMNEVPINKRYKDTIFRMLFREKKELLSLYNALNNSSYENENELEVVTLESAVYLGMKNDLAFILGYQMHLYEHQSTPSPNMPLRNLFYVSQEYQKLIEENKEIIYSSVLAKIPAPRFVVLYNGKAYQPECQILRLSDLYQQREENPMLELQVLMLNINRGNNEFLKDSCNTLKEYMLYVDKVRFYTDKEGLHLAEAVNKAVDECIKDGILADFLKKNRAEVMLVSLFEYDEEETRKKLIEIEAGEARRKGYAQGQEEGHMAGLKEGHEAGRNQEREELLHALMKNRNMTEQEAREALGLV